MITWARCRRQLNRLSKGRLAALVDLSYANQLLRILLGRGGFEPAPEHPNTGLQGVLSFAIAETGKEQMR